MRKNLYGVWSASCNWRLTGKTIRSNQPLTRNTITDLPAVYDELAQIRETNMAMDREENMTGRLLYCRACV